MLAWGHTDTFGAENNTSSLGVSAELGLGIPGEDSWTVLEIPW